MKKTIEKRGERLTEMDIMDEPGLGFRIILRQGVSSLRKNLLVKSTRQHSSRVAASISQYLILNDGQILLYWIVKNLSLIHI